MLLPFQGEAPHLTVVMRRLRIRARRAVMGQQRVQLCLRHGGRGKLYRQKSHPRRGGELRKGARVHFTGKGKALRVVFNRGHVRFRCFRLHIPARIAVKSALNSK